MNKKLSILFLIFLFIVSTMVGAQDIDPVDSMMKNLAENLDSGVVKSAPTTQSKLVGTWYDPNSNAKIVIISFLGNLYVRVYGACSPTPCDWGYSPAIAYATTVSNNVATGFTTDYDHGFATRIVTGKLVSGRLVVDIFTVMNDSRKNYYTTKTYTK